MHVIIIYMLNEDPTKSEEPTLLTRSIMATLTIKGDVTLPLLVQSDPFSNSFDILCMPLFSASYMKIQQNMKKLHCSQGQ